MGVMGGLSRKLRDLYVDLRYADQDERWLRRHHPVVAEGGAWATPKYADDDFATFLHVASTPEINRELAYQEAMLRYVHGDDVNRHLWVDGVDRLRAEVGRRGRSGGARVAAGGGARSRATGGVPSRAKHATMPLAVLDGASSILLRRVDDGHYEGAIHGVDVRVVRVAVGYHPHHHTYSKQPEWKVYARESQVLLADGNGTMKGAVAQAARSVELRGTRPTGRPTDLIQVGSARSGQYVTRDGSVRVNAVSSRSGFGHDYVAQCVADDHEVAYATSVADLQRKLR